MALDLFPHTRVQKIPRIQSLPRIDLSSLYTECNCNEHTHGCFSPPLTSIAANTLEERIIRSATDAHDMMDKMSRAQTSNLLKELEIADKAIHKEIREFATDPALVTQADRLNRLTTIKSQIDIAIDEATERMALLMPEQTVEAFYSGIEEGVDSVRAMEPPGWEKTTIKSVPLIASSAFGVIDTSGLNFWVNYRIELAGAVNEELKIKIKSALSQAVIDGSPMREVTRKLGHVVKNPAAFKEAGVWTEKGFSGKIFPSASDRLRLIVETENMRIHNQGRVAFYKDVGIKRIRWNAFAERCPICDDLHNQVFDIAAAPNMPAHPDCICIWIGESNDNMKAAEEYAA